MKFFIQLVAIIFIAFILELFLPWWCIAMASFAGGYALKSRFNFLAGFLGIGLLWLAKAGLIDATGSSPLAEQVATIFSLNKTLLYLATVLIGGLVGGFASMSGATLKKDKR